MSLRHAVLGLVAEHPRSGYEIGQAFELFLSDIWFARTSQIYPELARLNADGLVRLVSKGPRGAKRYEITQAGLEEMWRWLHSEPSLPMVRSEPLLRDLFLWMLPGAELEAALRRERAQLEQRLRALDRLLGELDWETSAARRCYRLVVERSRRWGSVGLDWVDEVGPSLVAGCAEPALCVRPAQEAPAEGPSTESKASTNRSAAPPRKRT
jgi:PadR family transcriptional regulator AphA